MAKTGSHCEQVERRCPFPKFDEDGVINHSLYSGDPEFTNVPVKQIDSRTILESNINAGYVVKIATWFVSPDGKTMHVRFDDTKGHIQEQDPRKVQ